jgi:hypothetical protein
MRLDQTGSATNDRHLLTATNIIPRTSRIMVRMRMRQALRLAVSQHGIVLRQQLIDIGLSPRTIHRRSAEGLWIAHGKRVLVLAGTPDDLATRSRIAALRTPGSILTGPSSAALRPSGPWNVSTLGTTPWLICPGRRRVPGRLVSHPNAATQRLGLWLVTSPLVAVVDMLRFLDFGLFVSEGV